MSCIPATGGAKSGLTSICQLPARIGVARAATPRYLETVRPLEAIVEDLKSLPPAKLEAADDLNRVIEEGCEKIDESGW